MSNWFLAKMQKQFNEGMIAFFNKFCSTVTIHKEKYKTQSKSHIVCTVFTFLMYLFFYWRIIALQNFVVFCQTSTWISHRYTYIPSLLNLPPHSTPLGRYRAPVWVLWAIQQIPAVYFTYSNVSFHVTLSIHLTLSSPLLMSISLFSMSVSPLLPCK